jgi:hypothetical protein
MSFYDEASWVLIPEGIKEDVVYAQKPTDGLGDLAFTRASDATRTNSAGVIERTPWNLFQMSEMFADAYWTKINTTPTANTTIAPNGTLTADTLVSSGGVNSFLYRIFSFVAGQSYTMSFYVKANSAQTIRIYGGGGGVGTSSNLNVTTDWTRISYTFTPNTSTGIDVGIRTNSANDNFNIFLWGAQLVEGTDAKPYFATTNRQDVPRLDYRNADGSLNSCPRLLLEPQRTNSLRNSTMVGAVAGSPGTLPTNWLQGSAIGGFTRTVVGVGVENGLQYVDVRYNGTAINVFGDIFFEAPSGIASANAANWTQSIYLKLIAAPSPPLATRFAFRQFNSVPAFLSVTQSTAISLTSSLTRFDRSFTTNQATVAFVQPSLFFDFTLAATYDFTIRIAAPQMELGAYATTFIPTTTAAVTRLVDAASKTGVSSLIGQTEGTLFVDMNLLVRSGNAYFALAPNLGLTSNYIGVSFSPTIIQAEMVSSSVAQAAIQFVNSATGNFKIGLAYKQNDLAFYVNGVLIGTDTNATVPVCSQIGLFNYFQTMALQYNQAALFPTRLTNAQLAEITTL